MSYCVLINFTGAGILATFVPFGINWGQDGGQYGHGRLLGLFSGLNGFAFILVWFLVPSTNEILSLEDMNYVFGRSLKGHAKLQWKEIRDSMPLLEKLILQGQRFLCGAKKKRGDEENQLSRSQDEEQLRSLIVRFRLRRKRVGRTPIAGNITGTEPEEQLQDGMANQDQSESQNLPQREDQGHSPQDVQEQGLNNTQTDSSDGIQPCPR